MHFCAGPARPIVCWFGGTWELVQVWPHGWAATSPLPHFIMLRGASTLGRLGRRAAALSRAASGGASSPSIFRGVFPIMATPFRPDESLDLDGFRRAIAFMQQAGANGATIVGVLGESNRMKV